MLGAAHGGGHARPGRRRLHPRLEAEPRIEGHLDRVLGARPVEQGDHVTAAKGAIHAEFATVAGAERRGELGQQLPQKAPRRFAVVDVARPILHAQHLAALRLVRRDRIVARHFAVMRIEAALRPLHARSGRHHRAVDVDGESPRARGADRPRDDRRIERMQPRQVSPAQRPATSARPSAGSGAASARTAGAPADRHRDSADGAAGGRR